MNPAEKGNSGCSFVSGFGMRFEYKQQLVPDMKKVIPVIFFLFALHAYGQNTEKLDSEKGIFNIVLLTGVDTGYRSIFEDPDVYYPKYEYAMLESNYTLLSDSMPSAGGFRANKVFLSTYHDLITEIKVVFPFDSAVIKWFTATYGQPTLPFRTTGYESNKAQWSIAIWQGRDVRMVYTAKRYNEPGDSERSEVPDYIFFKVTSIQSEQMMLKNEEK